MKTTLRLFGFILIGLSSASATGVICELRRRKLLKKLLLDAADEGYETAYDIKFPKIHGLRQKNKDLKYGPVYPSF